MIYILTLAIGVAAYILLEDKKFRRIFIYTTVTVLSLTIALTYANNHKSSNDISSSEKYQNQSKPSVLTRSFGTGRIYGSGLDNSNKSDRLTCPVCNQNPHNEHCTYNGKRLSRYR